MLGIGSLLRPPICLRAEGCGELECPARCNAVHHSECVDARSEPEERGCTKGIASIPWRNMQAIESVLPICYRTARNSAKLPGRRSRKKLRRCGHLRPSLSLDFGRDRSLKLFVAADGCKETRLRQFAAYELLHCSPHPKGLGRAQDVLLAVTAHANRFTLLSDNVDLPKCRAWSLQAPPLQPYGSAVIVWNQSCTASRKRSISRSDIGQQWAIGPRARFNLTRTELTAFLLVN